MYISTRRGAGKCFGKTTTKTKQQENRENLIMKKNDGDVKSETRAKLATVLQPLRCFVIRNENDKLCLPPFVFPFPFFHFPFPFFTAICLCFSM